MTWHQNVLSIGARQISVGMAFHSLGAVAEKALYLQAIPLTSLRDGSFRRAPWLDLNCRVGSYGRRGSFRSVVPNVGPPDVLGLQLPEAFTTTSAGQDFWELKSKNFWRPKVGDHCFRYPGPKPFRVLYVKKSTLTWAQAATGLLLFSHLVMSDSLWPHGLER